MDIENMSVTMYRPHDRLHHRMAAAQNEACLDAQLAGQNVIVETVECILGLLESLSVYAREMDRVRGRRP